MVRKLPPLNAIRAFEAAARHLSFTRAAEELFVTQAAVSHQVKALEDHLGIPLFKRLNRSLLLTAEGQHYYPEVRDALDQIAHATHHVQKADQSGILTVSVIPSFASLWLVPRIHHFTQQYPDIDVRIAADDSLTDFNKDDVDCVVRYGLGGWTNVRADLLMNEHVFPVCAPHYIKDHPNLLKGPDYLKHHLLIHDYGVTLAEVHLTWGHWLEKANIKSVDHTRGPKFSHTYMAIQACLSGEGVAMGRSGLIQKELETGRLVRLYDLSVQAKVAFYFVSPQHTADRYKIKMFREWLLHETQDSRDFDV